MLHYTYNIIIDTISCVKLDIYTNTPYIYLLHLQKLINAIV